MTREEALEVLKTNYRCMTEEKNCPRTCEGCGLAMQPGELEEAIRVAIKTLEPKMGHWVLTDDDYVYCSECEDSYYARPIDASWYYCPHCGAKMKGVEE